MQQAQLSPSLPTMILVPAGVALAVTVLLTPLVRAAARRIGFVDRPAGERHKAHARAVPYGGGVVIWLAALAAAGCIWLAGWVPGEFPAGTSGTSDPVHLLWILLFGTVVFLVGLVDDRRPLPAWVRLAVQAGCAAGLWACGVRASGHVAGGGAFSLVLTVCWVVAITNAMNLLDNMDGLAAGVGAIAASVLCYPTLAVGPQPVHCAALLALVGACAGFLFYNWHPARIYMGDAGSTFIGFELSALSVAVTYYRYDESLPAVAVALPLLVLAVPLYDTARVLVIRICERRPLLSGDRRHASHRLLELGMSVPGAVITLYLLTLAMGLGGLMLIAEDSWRVYFGLGQGLVIVAVVAMLMAGAGKK